ncbi:cupin domain-containing protein [Faecalibaculum rodentium]|jgi:quercetin dioxygenase-like cupin family protein|uniref:Cupin type-2 domain-containing protein n=2 Tax=Faecalibaculum rodentium TaxID=1702221 RepID=A0A140DYT4_9FIRM|nr:cupin domain-containing protein [Faecalibaculum rodentium]AMK55811.1 hypothetical protein AALO17_26770 [Faecalibaculum rodentium]
MNTKAGELFSLTDTYKPVPGCTISGDLIASDAATATVFSLAADTDISAETYSQPKLILVLSGNLTVQEPRQKQEIPLKSGEALILEPGTLAGFASDADVVYLELTLHAGSFNSSLPLNEPFVLKDRVPVQPGRIVNMDLTANPGLKFVLMSFDEGTGLSEHAAPGEALLFGLDGTGVIGYEGQEHLMHAGENFKFAAGGRHRVYADGPFTMALLMELPDQA